MPTPPLASQAALLAPSGVLRACINLGNSVLARAGEAGAPPSGVSVDLARALAEELGVPVAWQVVEAAARSVEAVRGEAADLGFFAADPARSAGIAFTRPYLLIEGAYLVRAAAPLQDNAQVDQPGQTVVVGQGSAYDLHLSRHLQHARILRAPNPAQVLPLFHAQGAQVAAGIRPQLEEAARAQPGLRVLPGRFMVIEQALGLPAARGAVAREALDGFVARLLRDGRLAAALQRHRVTSARMADVTAPS